jgi:PAS domain S-box-containing protein
MDDSRKSREELIAELEALRKKTADSSAPSPLPRQILKTKETTFGLLERNTAPIYVVDIDGGVHFANTAACDLLGYTRDEILSKKNSDIIAYFKQEQFQDMLRNEYSLQIPSVHSGTYRKKNGEIMPVEIRTGMLVFDNEEFIITRFSSLTDETMSSELRHMENLEKLVENRSTEIIDINRQLRKEIDRRAEIESELEHDRNLLRTLIDNLPHSVYIKNTEGKYILTNKTHAKLLGAHDTKETMGKTVFDFLDTDQAQQHTDDDRRVIESGKPSYNVEMPLVSRSGETRWLLFSKIPLQQEDSNTQLICISRDITETKGIEDALEHERDLLHLLLNNVPSSIYFKDTHSRYIRVNAAWARRRNLSDPKDAIGKTDFDFFDRDFAQRAFEQEQQIMASGTPLNDEVEWVVDKKGKGSWNLVTKVALYDTDRNVIGTCGISHDITALKQAEDALQRERDMFNTLMDNIPDSIYIKDRQKKFRRCSKALAGRFGIQDATEMLGKTDFDYFDKQHAQETAVDEDRIISTGISLIGKIHQGTPPDRRDQWFSTTKVPVTDSNGKVIGVCGITREITQVKKVEQALQRAKDELELRVKERTQDLREANVRLESRIAQVNFLNTTSFELAQLIDLDELLPAVLHAFVSRFESADAVFCQRVDNRYRCVAATKKLDTEQGKKSAEQALSPFIKNDLQRPFLVSPWKSDEHVGAFVWSGLERYPVYLAIPAHADNRVVAIIQLFTTQEGVDVYEQEKTALATLAAHAGVCLTNAVHYKELEHSARLQGELDAARSIQRSFTPTFQPDIPRIALKGAYYPAFEVGGDYLDYFRNEYGDWILVIADVCGKGVPAALLMTVLRSTFRVEAQQERSAKKLLCAVNESMRINLDDRSFVTALCLIIKENGASMNYARAGHPMLLRIANRGKEVKNMSTDGIALGLTPEHVSFDSLIQEITIPLVTGDRFVLYTDGLTEAKDNQNQSYGFERLARLLKGDSESGPEKIIEKIMVDVKKFIGDAPYHDDLTIMALEVTP